MRVCVVFAFLLVASTPVMAAAIGPEKATELLARSQAINTKCGILAEPEQQELSDFVARAELSLAQKVSVKAAKAALTKGRALGRSALCDDASAQSVRDVLKAARQAADGMMDGSAVTTEPDLAPTVKAATDAVLASIEKPVVQPKPLPKAEKKVVALSEAPQTAKPVKKTEKPAEAAGGGSYGVLAENYYRELRCKSMPYKKVSAMYARVVREHKLATAAQGKQAVKKILTAAKARAANRSC